MMTSMVSTMASSVLRVTDSAIDAITRLGESIMVVGGFSCVMVTMVLVVTHRICRSNLKYKITLKLTQKLQVFYFYRGVLV